MPGRTIGRREEFKVLQERIGALRRRRGGVTIVEGPPGTGKTLLLRAAAAAAEAEGLDVLTARCEPAARTTQFAPLVEALLEAEPELHASALRAMCPLPDARPWVMRELEDWLAQRALQRPIMIVFDDVGHADEATLLALRVLPERLADDAILWVLGLQPAHAVRTRRCLEDAGATIVPLRPLTEPAIAELVEQVIGARPEGALLELTRELEAMPALLVDLMCSLRDARLIRVENGRAALTGVGPPQPVREIVANWVEGLSCPARDVVRLASILGRRWTAGHLADVLGRSTAALVAPLQELLASGLLADTGESLEFSNELLRQAILDTLPVTARRALQRQVVATLHEYPEKLAERAAVLQEVGVDELVSPDLLLRATRAVALRQPAVAADLSLRALSAMPAGDRRRPALTAHRVALLLRCGRGQEAESLAAGLLASADGPALEAELRLAIAGACATAAPSQAVLHARTTLHMPDMPDALRARAEVLLAAGQFMSGAWAEAASLAAQALERPDIAEEKDLAPQLRSAVCATERRYADALEFWRGQDPEDADVIGVWAHIAAGAAQAVLRSLDRGVARRGEDHPLWLSARARALLSIGRLSEATADARAAVRCFDDPATGLPFTIHAWHVLASAGLHTGDGELRDEAAGVAATMLTHPDLLVRRAGGWIAARLSIASGTHEAALELLSEAWPDLGRMRPTLCFPDPPWELLALRRALLAVEAPEGADAVVVEAQRRARLNPGLRGFALVAEQLRALAEPDPAALDSCVAELAATAGPIIGAEAAEDASRALGQGRASSATYLGQALRMFERAGAAADARRLQGTLTRRTFQQRDCTGWDALSPAELEVVHLVARGATNRDAAQQLFLSPHTVSSHLRSAFRKLGIRSRVELAAMYARRPAGCAEPRERASSPFVH